MEHQEGIEKEWSKKEIARGAKPGGISFKTKYDIKKRDSIITPYLGVIEMTQTLRAFVPAGDSVCTVQLLYTNGKWIFGHAETADQQFFGGWKSGEFEALTEENIRKSVGGHNLLWPLRWEFVEKLKYEKK